MVADHQDDGQSAQGIDLPDALSAVRLSHGVRILRAAGRRQGNVGRDARLLEGPGTG
jgi:hypothetical protein